MGQLKNDFLTELSNHLKNHPEKASILAEYEIHIDELLLELFKLSDEEIEQEMYKRLGTPKEIALIWEDELSVTPSKMKWLFVVINIFFFCGGATLTLVHNLFEWNWVAAIWGHLTSVPILIALVYMFFWALLGYEIGKGFGHKGKSIMKKTFILAIIPNLTLMVLTVFHIIPHEWFHPLLSETLILLCIVFTILLYPICVISYKWGKKASL